MTTAAEGRAIQSDENPFFVTPRGFYRGLSQSEGVGPARCDSARGLAKAVPRPIDIARQQ